MASGKLAVVVSAFPGAEVHEPLDAKFPGDAAAASVPVALPPTEPRMSTGIAGARTTAGGMVLELMDKVDEPAVALVAPMGLIEVAPAPAALIEVVGFTVVMPAVADVTLMTEGDSSATNGEQFTAVPAIVGSCAKGGVASVVAGAPATVAAEKRLVNGLGPVRGDDTIAPGVVGSPIAVVPTVDICA